MKSLEGPGRDDAAPATPESALLQNIVAAVPKPLIRQAVLLVPMLCEFVARLVWGQPSSVSGFYLLGLSIMLAATGAALTATYRSTGSQAAVVILLLDLAAIGMMRLVPEGNGLGILAVLPAMWLASEHRMRGVAMSLVGTLLLVSLPSLLYFGPEPAWWSRALLVPAVATMCALTVAGTAEVWARQNHQLEQQGQRLEAALCEVMSNRALNEAIVSTVDVGLVALDGTGRTSR